MALLLISLYRAEEGLESSARALSLLDPLRSYLEQGLLQTRAVAEKKNESEEQLWF